MTQARCCNETQSESQSGKDSNQENINKYGKLEALTSSHHNGHFFKIKTPAPNTHLRCSSVSIASYSSKPTPRETQVGVPLLSVSQDWRCCEIV